MAVMPNVTVSAVVAKPGRKVRMVAWCAALETAVVAAACAVALVRPEAAWFGTVAGAGLAGLAAVFGVAIDAHRRTDVAAIAAGAPKRN